MVNRSDIGEEEGQRGIADVQNFFALVDQDFKPGGSLANIFPTYEHRPVQREMALLIAKAIAEERPAILEAPVGSGKSLAYLSVAARSGLRTIISTGNKSLQEQIFYKDFPTVQQMLGENIAIAMAKGAGNYFCLARLNEQRENAPRIRHPDLERVLQVVDNADTHFSGDIDMLDFQIAPPVKSLVAFDGNYCTGQHCAYYDACYITRMQQNAKNAKIIVVNHTLLILDAILKNYLLPKHELIIIDEAHSLEEEAIHSFTITITFGKIGAILDQPFIRDLVNASLQEAVQHAKDATWKHLSQIEFAELSEKQAFTKPIPEGSNLATLLNEVANELESERPSDLSIKEGTRYNRLVARTRELAREIGFAFAADTSLPFAYCVERLPNRQGGQQFQVSATPLVVAPLLKKYLFEKHLTICTSATLSTIDASAQTFTHPVLASIGAEPAPSFTFFQRNTGWETKRKGEDGIERIFPQTFPYQQNALLYLPTHLPEPRYVVEQGGRQLTDEYLQALANEMSRLVRASRGRAFLLFSSKQTMEAIYERLGRDPKLASFLFFVQGGALTRKEMLRAFRDQPEYAVLLGLKSFSEGVDIAGEALSLVVMDKIPFVSPQDPILQARERYVTGNGENWFGTYMLPEVILRLKQGLGRLIRTSSDRGVMAILDTRLHNRRYAQTILSSLPPARRTTRFSDVEHFFQMIAQDTKPAQSNT